MAILGEMWDMAVLRVRKKLRFCGQGDVVILRESKNVLLVRLKRDMAKVMVPKTVMLLRVKVDLVIMSLTNYVMSSDCMRFSHLI